MTTQTGHTEAIAAAAYALAGRSPGADDALLAGLLHDIGYWILLQQRPQTLGGRVQRRAGTGSGDRRVGLGRQGAAQQGAVDGLGDGAERDAEPAHGRLGENHQLRTSVGGPVGIGSGSDSSSGTRARTSSWNRRASSRASTLSGV